MKRRRVITVLLMAGLCSQLALAQEQVEKKVEPKPESKELKFAGAPYFYTGPDTGLGFGFSIQFRDIFDKVGRDTTLSTTITQTRYQNFSLSWAEPNFLSPNGRLSLSLSYDNKPALRFYGIGNDTLIRDDSNWSWVSYSFAPTYAYRFPNQERGVIGMRVGMSWALVNPDNGDLKDKSDVYYYRKIKEVYPGLYHSKYFDPTTLVGVGITLYHDSRKDRFPLGGGREEVVWPLKGTYEEINYSRYDEAIGSDFSYNAGYLDVRGYFPLFSEDTIIAVRGKINLTQGDVPFYRMPGFGTGTDLRGYYGMRFIDLNTSQFQVELRQALAPNFKISILGGRLSAKYPSLVLFWDEGRVHHDYATMGDDLFEDYHYTWGWGLRVVVTPTIVLKAEYGYSDEQNTFTLGAGLPF